MTGARLCDRITVVTQSQIGLTVNQENKCASERRKIILNRKGVHGMPAVHEFGIIMSLDKNKDYGYYNPEAYNCVDIDDDAMYGWAKRIETMKSYFHCFNRPAAGLAWCGVTLIPPESLDLFHDIVAKNTSIGFIEQVPPLLDIISKAKKDNKFIIHFGI